MTIKEQLERAKKQQLLTVEQFSLLTQYHVQSVYRMIRLGRLRVVRIGGWAIRIPYSEAKITRAQHPRADSTLSL